jgi:hypothetical protein
MSKYITGLWDDAEDVFDSFEEPRIPGAEILYAHYTDEDYCGYGAVVYLHGGNLYMVEGSHCSCNGLEGQWVPIQTTVGAMRMMRESAHRPEFKQFLDYLETDYMGYVGDRSIWDLVKDDS